MTPIQFGWVVPNGPRDADTRGTFVADVGRALAMIADHFDSAWMTDHLQINQQDVLECWSTISYFAAMQPKLRFGTVVLGQSYRNPALTAKMAATLQFLSGGRVLFGIGAGWKEDEYHAYGYDFPSNGVRVEQLEETVQIIKALWTEEQATFHGRYYQIAQARCDPKPAPLPPMVIGGSKPRMLRLIARYADWWTVSWTGIDDYRAQVAELTRACAEVGRDPATLRRLWFGPCACAPTEADARTLANERFSNANGFLGTPDQVVEQMRPFVELGVDYFIVGSASFPDTTTLELVRDRVLPALNAELG
jgi:alkanesulfonate monooxygenase SsuD/methylene tetrahydromethanopterin reductase-like flavin-dependent oxidoreductase (luciferase family)